MRWECGVVIGLASWLRTDSWVIIRDSQLFFLPPVQRSPTSASRISFRNLLR